MTGDQAQALIQGIAGGDFTVTAGEKDGPHTVFRLLAEPRKIPAGIVMVEDRFFYDLGDAGLSALISSLTKIALGSARSDPAARRALIPDEEMVAEANAAAEANG